MNNRSIKKYRSDVKSSDTLSADYPSYAFSSYDLSENTSISVPYNRFRHLPLIEQRKSLPIYKYVKRFLWGIQHCRVLIVTGETGSGKSTQCPQYLNEAKWLSRSKKCIVCMPTPLSVISVCKRVATEMATNIGEKVGYRTFETSCISSSTVIQYVTDDILLKMIQRNPLLLSYKVVIIDDCHQRRKESDIILGLLKKIHKKRPYLRVILLSATCDITIFVNFFDDFDQSIALDDSGKTALDNSVKHDSINDNSQPINTEDLIPVKYLKIKGKLFPVNIYYLKQPTLNYVKATFETIIMVHKKHRNTSAMLAFLTGKDEINMVICMLKEELCRNPALENMDILPLYSGMPVEMQFNIFKRSNPGCRKVIIATNIAELSLTIDDVGIVIDSGFTKCKYVDHYTSINQLCIAPCSKFSAIQRAGRSCRTEEGYCYRLYTEPTYDNLLIDFSLPEISRSSLTQIILYLMSMGIDNFVTQVDLPSPVSSEAITEGLRELYALEAIDEFGRLTENLGIIMVDLPFDPKLSRFLLLSTRDEFKCSYEAIVICSMIKSGNPWVVPPSNSKLKSEILQANMRSIGVSEGDFVTLYNVYQQSLFQKNEDSGWNSRHMISSKAISQASKIKTQLEKFFKHKQLPIVSCGTNITALCQAISAGLFWNAAYRQRHGEYKLCRDISKYIFVNTPLCNTFALNYSPNTRTTNVSLAIHPFSLTNPKQPNYIVFFEGIAVQDLPTSQSDTNCKAYLSGVTTIHPTWLRDFSGHFFQLNLPCK